MTAVTPHAVYVRTATKPRRWRLHDVYGSHAAAMAAAVGLKVPAVWVTAIEASGDADTELTPEREKGRISAAGGLTKPLGPPRRGQQEG